MENTPKVENVNEMMEAVDASIVHQIRLLQNELVEARIDRLMHLARTLAPQIATFQYVREDGEWLWPTLLDKNGKIVEDETLPEDEDGFRPSLWFKEFEFDIFVGPIQAQQYHSPRIEWIHEDEFRIHTRLDLDPDPIL